MSIPAVLALIVSAAVFEEILHRGYPIQRLTELTRHTWTAVALTLPIFVLPHIAFFGPHWLLYQGSGTAVLYILFLWRRNLIACIMLHLCINLPILIPTIASRVS
jgi:membrane protease YdiL (CAAX protease family)